MSELNFMRSVRKGQRGMRVRRVQEWLTLNGLGLVVDGDFGSATDFAVRQYQEEQSLPRSGVVTEAAFEHLTRPMRSAVESVTRPSLGESALAAAFQHLRAGAREVGGQNRGPWVRLYMKGREGEAWPWCAGFVCFALRQACQAQEVAMPIEESFSCDWLAASAKQRNLFLPGSQMDPGSLAPGTLFLQRRATNDWNHVGLVVEAGDSVFSSIEGNTNDSGGREGYLVCRRIRGYDKKDFILLERGDEG